MRELWLRYRLIDQLLESSSKTLGSWRNDNCHFKRNGNKRVQRAASLRSQKSIITNWLNQRLDVSLFLEATFRPVYFGISALSTDRLRADHFVTKRQAEIGYFKSWFQWIEAMSFIDLKDTYIGKLIRVRNLAASLWLNFLNSLHGVKNLSSCNWIRTRRNIYLLPQPKTSLSGRSVWTKTWLQWQENNWPSTRRKGYLKIGLVRRKVYSRQ